MPRFLARLPLSLLTLGLVGLPLCAQDATVVVPATVPTPAVTTPAGPTSPAELAAQIDAFVLQPRFTPALWSIQVQSLDSGQILYAHQPDRRMSPGSNTKLFVAALALDRYGPEFRIATPIAATQAPDATGTLHGDLIVSGRGDPTWTVRRNQRDFWSNFDPIVDLVKAAGVRHITGDVVGDATHFHVPPYGAGWTADDLNDYYGAEVSALTLEENYAEIAVSPSTAIGDPATLALIHPHTGLTLDNRTVTTVAGSETRLFLQRIVDNTSVQLWGEIAADAAPRRLDVTVPRPATWFARCLKEALQRAGITVAGEARGVRWPDAGPDPLTLVTLGQVSSVPLRDLVTGFMKPSHNLYTDLFFATIGESARTTQTPDWVRSDALALDELQAFLVRNDLARDDVLFEEGSGLSRNNLTSAAAIVRLLEFMSRHPEGPAFAASLPIAGVDGTLRRRMKGTAAEGNLRGKTGTLRWTSCLSGYVTSATGERLAFSLLLNRNNAPEGRSNIQDLDTVATLLAAYAAPR